MNFIAPAAENERRVSFSGEKPLKILITQRRGAVQPADEPIKRVACRLFDDPPKGDENAARSVILLTILSFSFLSFLSFFSKLSSSIHLDDQHSLALFFLLPFDNAKFRHDLHII